jgi:hypothetical protein
MNDDSTLQEHFASLRRAEEASTPGFEAVCSLLRRRRNRGSWGLFMAAAGALVAVTAAVMVALTVTLPVRMVRVTYPHQSPTIGTATDAAAPMLADWHSPTDFLLDAPGRELLHTIPDIGRYPSMQLGSHPPTRTNIPARRAGPEHS